MEIQPNEERAVVLLFDVPGLTCQEMAEVLDSSKETVMRRLLSARRTLEVGGAGNHPRKGRSS
ncbi:RNA polymerase sigma factor [Caballeronia glathei]|uniref:RNA polymerase sigma factor n=1 Tax=Caballeronia glathei TaxID=60547 RepID=UPI003520EDFB